MLENNSPDFEPWLKQKQNRLQPRDQQPHLLIDPVFHCLKHDFKSSVIPLLDWPPTTAKDSSLLYLTNDGGGNSYR